MTYNPYPSYSGRWAYGNAIKPLWTIKFEEEQDLLDWFKTTTETIGNRHRETVNQDNIRRDFYMGLQSLSVGRDGIPRDRDNKPIEKFARVTINQCYEFVEQWVSKLARFTPAIAIIPPNQEYNDRIAARLSKDFIDYLFYVNDMDMLLEQAARNSRIDGETFMFVDYNKAKGDLHPDFQAANSLGIRVPLVNAAGEPVLNEQGEQIFIDKAQRIGDVDYRVVQRKYVLKEPKVKWKDVNWVIEIDTCDIDELKAQYPDRVDEIEKRSSIGAQFLDTFSADTDMNEVLVFQIYHRSTEFLDHGRYIKLLQDVVLENTTLREKCGHDELPCARLTNIDVPGICDGFSFLDQIMLLQVMYNNFASIMYTNAALGAHIYWMVPGSANVDLKKLKSGASVISYAGGIPPRIEQFKTMGPELFQGLDFITNAMQRISRIHGISRDNPPTGVEAGIALAFFEEQENQSQNTDIKKYNAFIKKIARLSLATAGAFYKAEDGRTMRIVGKNNQFSIKALDVAKLGGPYDIRVQRSTALSESKAGRLSQILALEGRFPGMLPREQILDMLDLANDQQFYDLTTVSVQAAEYENEQMAEGIEVEPALEYEDHLIHLEALLKYMQTSSFKQDMPPERKTLFALHGMSHEFFIHSKMINPIYAAKVTQMFPGFPFFSIPGQIGAPLPGADLGLAPGLNGAAGPPSSAPLPPDLENQPDALPEADNLPQGDKLPTPPATVPETPEKSPVV